MAILFEDTQAKPDQSILSFNKLADLQKGDAVMIVSTQSANAGEVTAIELVGGVEPILTAPNGGQMMTLSPWNLSGGAEGDIQN